MDKRKETIPQFGKFLIWWDNGPKKPKGRIPVVRSTNFWLIFPVQDNDNVWTMGAGKFQIFILQNLGIFTGFVIMLCIDYFEEDLTVTL